MSNIRKSLESLADSIEQLEKQPVPKPEIKDRSLSGNKINGGMITNFSSVGISDEATQTVIAIKNEGLHVDNAFVKTIANPLTVDGNLDVKGEVYAEKLHVNEISSDLRNERTSPLEFQGDGKAPVGKGLIWTGGGHTKQFILKEKPDRLWASESLDLYRGRVYMIGGETVLDSTKLGNSVVDSNLKSVGNLRQLNVNGSVNINHFVKYNADNNQFSIGAEEPNGMFSMESFDHQFVIDPTENKNWKIGSWTTSGVDIITDDTVRIQIENTGKVTFHNKTSFQQPIGIGVKNFEDDVDLTVSGAVRFDNKKQETAETYPTSGNYRKGDIVWNTEPKPTGYVGWICIKAGQPGEWKPFGQISA